MKVNNFSRFLFIIIVTIFVSIFLYKLNPQVVKAWNCGDTFVDTRDNKSYTTVLIGYQCWMAENLAYLPSVVGPSAQWASTTEVRYAVSGYTSTNNSVEDAKSTPNYLKYGVLYNWTASANACPDGWYLPSDSEWHVLEYYLTDEGQTCDESRGDAYDCMSAGNKIKGQDTGFLSWIYTNESGFNALPGGFRYVNGNFGLLGSAAGFRTSTEFSATNLWVRDFWKDVSTVSRNARGVKSGGCSIRCLKYYTVPTISRVSYELGSLSDTQLATITWTTNEASSTQLEYGTTQSYGTTTTEQDTDTRVTSHTATITIPACSIYHVRVISKDEVNNSTNSQDITIQTHCATPGNALANYTIGTVAIQPQTQPQDQSQTTEPSQPAQTQEQASQQEQTPPQEQLQVELQQQEQPQQPQAPQLTKQQLITEIKAKIAELIAQLIILLQEKINNR